MAPQTKIVIIDPLSLAREGLRHSLMQNKACAVIAEASDAVSGLYALARHPDALPIVNVQLPDADLPSLLARHYRDAPADALHAIVSQMPEEPALLRACLQNGARGLIGRNAGAHEYVAAIDAVLLKGCYISADLVDVFLDEDTPRVGRSNCWNLTAREIEILSMLSDGLSNKEIANSLCLSVRTVEAHRLNIRQKTGANILSELVRVAREIRAAEQDGERGNKFAPRPAETTHAFDLKISGGRLV